MSSYDYIKSPQGIYEQSFQIIRSEAERDLASLPADLVPIAVRLMHAVGMTDLVSELRFSTRAVEAGLHALVAGKPILVDAQMVAGGITRRFLDPENGGHGNEVLVTLNDPCVWNLAEKMGTTRSAAALELWRPHLDGAIVSIGNAPTALFRLLEMIKDGAPKPALILGFPVGFVGAAESKDALANEAAVLGLNFLTLTGRRGGTPMASSAVNALALMALGREI
ncbi:MAG: precorrin-8X methylmutase [Cohaesibacter sp.]|nr:precorrin-8X methylmutase [Cohaesibacter sp.]